MKNYDLSNQMALEFFKYSADVSSSDKIPTGVGTFPVNILQWTRWQQNSSRIPIRISITKSVLTAELTLVACFPSETNAELPFLALSSTEQGQLFLVDQHTGQ